jgi:hypothetical protein
LASLRRLLDHVHDVTEVDNICLLAGYIWRVRRIPTRCRVPERAKAINVATASTAVVEDRITRANDRVLERQSDRTRE